MGVGIQMQLQNRGTVGIISSENHKSNGACLREGKVSLMDGTMGQQEPHSGCKKMTRVCWK